MGNIIANLQKRKPDKFEGHYGGLATPQDFSEGNPALKDLPTLISEDEFLLSQFDVVESKKVFPMQFCAMKRNPPEIFVMSRDTVSLTNRRIVVVSQIDPSWFLLRMLKKNGLCAKKSMLVRTRTSIKTFYWNNVTGLESSSSTVLKHSWGTGCDFTEFWCPECFPPWFPKMCPKFLDLGIPCPKLCLPMDVQDSPSEELDTILLRIAGDPEPFEFKVPYAKAMQIRADILHVAGRFGNAPASPALQVMNEVKTAAPFSFGKDEIVTTVVPRKPVVPLEKKTIFDVAEELHKTGSIKVPGAGAISLNGSSISLQSENSTSRQITSETS